MEKIELRFDLKREKIIKKKINNENIIGGRHKIAKEISDNKNRFIISNGLFTNTNVPCSSRISVGGVSPLTGTIKESNAGGDFAKSLNNLNIHSIVFENKCDSQYVLKLDKTGATFISAKQIKINNTNTYKSVEKIKKYFKKDNLDIMVTGKAGEMNYKNSSIMFTDKDGNPSRAAARGGLGKLMDEKGLKAIVIDKEGDNNEIDFHNEKLSKEGIKQFALGLKQNQITSEALPAFGTAVLVNMVDALEGLPTQNFQKGSFKYAEQISGENLKYIQEKRDGENTHSCMTNCPIKCSNSIKDKDKNYITSGFEYETIAMLGSNTNISDLDKIAEIDRKCDELGIDTIETGVTMGICMEAGKIPWGDGDAVLNLLDEMEKGTKLGKVLGEGAEYVGKYFNVNRVPTVKGQAIAGYDPRTIKGTGVTYATSPMGADHTAAPTVTQDVNHINGDENKELSFNMQKLVATIDSLGLCLFTSFILTEEENYKALNNVLKGIYGDRWNDLIEIGTETIELEQKINNQLNVGKDELPGFFYKEPIGQNNVTFDITFK